MIKKDAINRFNNRGQSDESNQPYSQIMSNGADDSQGYNQNQQQSNEQKNQQHSSQNITEDQINKNDSQLNNNCQNYPDNTIQNSKNGKISNQMRNSFNRSNSNENQTDSNLNLAITNEDSINEETKVNECQSNSEITSQKQNQDKQSVSLEINLQLQQLNAVSTNFKEDFHKLFEVQKYMPDVSKLEQNNNFVTTISNFKKLIQNLQCKPNDFLNLQHQFESKVKIFIRLQNQIVQRIENHFKITYKLQESDLGELQKDNNAIIEDLEKLKQDFEKNCKNIQDFNIIQYISDINESLKEIHGRSLNEDQSKQIQGYRLELNNLVKEKNVEVGALCNKYKEYLLLLSTQENDLTFYEKEVSDLNDLILSLKKQAEEMDKQAQNEHNDYKEMRNQILNSIRNQKKELQQKLTLLQGNQENEQVQIHQKLLKQLDILTESYSVFQSASFSTKKDCLHYIFLIDQSESFRSAYSQAINGVLQFAQNLQSNDFLQVISFSQKAETIIEKKNASNFNQFELKQKLSKYLGGGTSFLNAFNYLKNVISKTLRQNEFPVVVFITDGQDNADTSIIIQDVLRQIESLIFYTIGYGFQINERQLKLITNLFNKTNNLTKEFGNKNIQLYYQNKTPEQLCADIISVSDNKLTIEQIEKAKLFLKNSVQTQTNVQDIFYAKQKKQIEDQISSCICKEKEFLESDRSLKQFQDKFKTQQIEINNSIKSFTEKRLEKQKECSKIQSNINILKNRFYNQNLKDSENESDQIISKSEEIQKLSQQKIAKICKEYDLLIQNAKHKIDKTRQEQVKAIEDNQQSIKSLGFQNVNQYYKFQDLYEGISLTQQSAMNIKQKYVLLLELLIDIGKMLKQNITFSQINIQNMNKTDTQDRILEYYQKFDNTINLAEKSESKKKVLLIQNSSILQMCKEEGKEKLYQKCINNLEFNTLFQLVDKERREQDKIISLEIVPQIIKYNKTLSQVQDKIKLLTSKNKQKQQEIDSINDDDNIEKEQKARKIQSLESQLENTKQQLEAQKEQESTLISDYYDQNFDDIKIVKQITLNFVEAIQNASIQLKYFFAVKPYYNYIQTIQNVKSSFQHFQNPQLQDSSKQASKFKIMN